jgi:tetratricopeptide (TPR) repeat protein
VAGTGAGTFRIARLRYRKDELVSGHAHGYVPQTLADLGLVGLLATLALLAAWLAAGARSTGLIPRLRRRAEPAPRRDWQPERIALVCVALVAVVFGVQSAIDWTWFVPGPAVMALGSAGFVAGRGTLPALGEPSPAPPLSPDSREPIRIAAAVAVGITALLCAWTIWQPEASDRASNRAVDLIDAGKLGQARAEAKDAHDANPLSPRPYILGASVEAAAGHKQVALDTLEEAVLKFPGDPQTWLRLAGFQLSTLDEPDQSLKTLGVALYLDPHSKIGAALFLQARQRSRAKQVEAAQAQQRRQASAAKRSRRK